MFETPDDVVAAARAHFLPPAGEDGAEPRVRFLSGGCGVGVWARRPRAGLSEQQAHQGQGLVRGGACRMTSSWAFNHTALATNSNPCKFMQIYTNALWRFLCKMHMQIYANESDTRPFPLW